MLETIEQIIENNKGTARELTWITYKKIIDNDPNIGLYRIIRTKLFIEDWDFILQVRILSEYADRINKVKDNESLVRMNARDKQKFPTVS